MPKTKEQESILHPWVELLTFQQQALLMTAIRGPDENNKYNAAKAIVRYLRGAVIKPAGDWSGTNDNDFMWGDYDPDHGFLRGDGVKISWFQYYSDLFWRDHDEYPHHFIMHLVHCAEVIGYKWDNEPLAFSWYQFYIKACEAFHVNPETEEQMDRRLNDFGCGWHNSKTPSDGSIR